MAERAETWYKDGMRKQLIKKYGRWCVILVAIDGDLIPEGQQYCHEFKTKAEAIKFLKGDGYKPFSSFQEQEVVAREVKL